MASNEFDFILEDRIAKIQAINKQYDLENNAFISFSGGKDSCVLSKLIDLALPNNNIPRVFANTGIEFLDIVRFVKDLAQNDERIIILKQDKNIKLTLQKYGYPFKSKAFAHNYSIFQNMGEKSKTYQAMKNSPRFGIPPILEYMFVSKNIMPFKISELCCYKLKKDLVHKWQKTTNRQITLTGIRQEEGGNRINTTCTIFSKDNLIKFHPLLVVSKQWEEWFIKQYNISLCKLYYPPYNFKRTGCRGCPFSLNLQQDLLTMKKLLPIEYNACLKLWKPVYDEYVRLGYRLDKDFYTKQSQYTIYDFIEKDKEIKND